MIEDFGGNQLPYSKILVYVKTNFSSYKEQIQIGDIIEGKGKLYFFERPSNPGQFDRSFYYLKNGISASVTADHVVVKKSEPDFLKEKTAEFRQWWKQILVTELGDHYGNIMSAIFLGDRREVDQEVKELYQKSGIGHILAISGLHMAFLGVGIYQLLRKCGVGFLGAGAAGILFLLIYYVMIGESVSAFRALIMFGVKMGAEITGRTYDLLTATAIAAGIILIRRPLYLLDSGFLLSFGAILGIALLSNELKHMRIPSVFAGSLAIQIMTFPVMLYYYYELPLLSILINLVVVPLMSLIFACGVTAPLIGIFWLTGRKLLLKICAYILMGYEKVCEGSMHIPIHRIISGRPAKWMIIGYYLTLFVALTVAKSRIFSEKKREKSRSSLMSIACALCVTFSIMMLFENKIISNQHLRIVMLDVGQGEAIYMHTPSGKNILIDGGSSSVSDVGKYRIEPFLKSQGIAKIDYIFVSHGDSDHISAITEMLENQTFGVVIKKIVMPAEEVLDDTLWKLAETAEENGTSVATIKENETIAEQNFQIQCLAPVSGIKENSDNAASMVLCVRYKQFKILLTGDFEGEEDTLAKKTGQCDILKVAHHGSKNSTGEEFLKQVCPKIAIISAGVNNRYGHPHEETINRLEKYTNRIYNTQTSGAIEIRTDGKHIEIEEYLK